MLRLLILTLAFTIISISYGQAPDPAAAPAAPDQTAVEAEPEAEKDWKLSYALGVETARGIQSQSSIDARLFLRAVDDVLEGRDLLLSDKEGQAVTNLEASTAFFDTNKSEEGVKVTASGLQYQVLETSAGDRPTAADTVTINYTVYRLDGEAIDSTKQLGKPVSYEVGTLLPGWREGLQLMGVGSTYRLFFPPALAYGETGAPPAIEPNMALIVDVELLSKSTGGGPRLSEEEKKSIEDQP
jgi:FKBP-type peptidyl-prolyl cis-trans isomerase